MSTALEQVEKEVLKLPREARAFLADRLLSSLGDQPLSDIDSAWVSEVERRYSEHASGARQTVVASDVFTEAKQMLK